MTSDGASKDDVKVPEGDLGVSIQEGFDAGKDLLVTIISAMNEEAVRPFPYFILEMVVIWNLICFSRPSPSRMPLKPLRSVKRVVLPCDLHLPKFHRNPSYLPYCTRFSFSNNTTLVMS